MALFDAITYAVAEVTAYVAGKATGRMFKLHPKDATPRTLKQLVNTSSSGLSLLPGSSAH